MLLGADVSFYQDDDVTPLGINFEKLKAAGAGYVIIRAGQNVWPDPDFKQNWATAKAQGLARGSYWFYDSRVEPERQAELWVELLGWDLGELPLFADFEDRYKGAYDGWGFWVRFLNRLRELVAEKEIAIYTAYYYWHEKVPAASRPLFAGYPLWVANYGVDKPKLPEPWTEWLFWQFTEEGDGKKYGAESDHIDLNYFNGDQAAFEARFKLTHPTPPPAEVSGWETHEGVTVHVVNRFGCKCVIHQIELGKVQIAVSGDGFNTVSGAVNKYKAQGGVNGGGWPNVQSPGHRSNEIWASGGVIKQGSAIDNRPYLNITEAGIPIFHLGSQLSEPLFNAYGFDRVLGMDGKFNERISDRKTKDARTGTGVSQDGQTLILLSAEGDDRFQRGLTFPEMWEVLHEFGAYFGGNNDGGSSSAVVNLALSQQSLIMPSDGVEARVINHVLFFAKPTGNLPEEPEPEGEKMKYEVKKSARFRSAPTMKTNDTGASSIPGDTFESTKTQADSNNPAILMVQHPNGKWLPMFIEGIVYTQELHSVPQPPDPGPAHITHTIDVYSDGTLSIDGGPRS